MEWVFVALIVGTMVYSGSIVVEYFKCSIRIQTRLASLETGAVELGKESGDEETIQLEVHGRIDCLKESMQEFQGKIAELRGKQQAERDRKQKLEMEVFKKRLKSGRYMQTA